MKYILKGKTAVPTDNIIEWAKWFESADRHVAKTELNGVRVSTVFLGLEHGSRDGKPLLFETMVFGGEHDGHQERHTTWEEAEAVHKEILYSIFQSIA